MSPDSCTSSSLREKFGTNPVGPAWHGQGRAPAPQPRVLVSQREAPKATRSPTAPQRGGGRADAGNVAEERGLHPWPRGQAWVWGRSSLPWLTHASAVNGR